MKSVILATSGFILPENKWFSSIDSSADYRSQLLKKKNPVEGDYSASGLYKSGEVYTSHTANKLLLEYIHNNSFDNFMAMVDFTCDVFEDYSLLEFITVQSNNPFLSPTGWMFCSDLSTLKLLDNYKQYLVAPSFFRLIGNSTSTDLGKRVVNKTPYSFTDVITNMYVNKDCFVAFFKYMFTDSSGG